jgi:hypothetical protein
VAAVSEREILVRIGLAGLDREDALEVMSLFQDVLQLRIGRRIFTVLGPQSAQAIETQLQATPEAYQRALKFFSETIPDYNQYVEEEIDRLVRDFRARLEDAVEGSDVGGSS